MIEFSKRLDETIVACNIIDQYRIKAYPNSDIFEAIVAFSNSTLNAIWSYQFAPLNEIINDLVLKCFPKRNFSKQSFPSYYIYYKNYKLLRRDANLVARLKNSIGIHITVLKETHLKISLEIFYLLTLLRPFIFIV